MESSKTLKVGSHKKNISKKNKVKLWDEFDIQEQTPQNTVSVSYTHLTLPTNREV